MNPAVLITCLSLIAVDGDTIKCGGVNMRAMGDGKPFVSGFDTPEIWGRKCQAELELARKAKVRMQELLDTPGVQIRDSGEVDRTSSKRPLVWVILPDGRSAGSILIEEGLAREWTPGYKADWCRFGQFDYWESGSKLFGLLTIDELIKILKEPFPEPPDLIELCSYQSASGCR